MLEKLVEKIRKSWCQDCKMADIDDASGFDNCGLNEQFACDERVRQSITRIGKAYVDGLPLPDEVGRGTLHWKHGTFTLEVSDALTLEVYGTFRGDKGNLPFIALRKEGMDKKEE